MPAVILINSTCCKYLLLTHTNIHDKLLQSDWLREVQLLGNALPKPVPLKNSLVHFFQLPLNQLMAIQTRCINLSSCEKRNVHLT